MPILWEGVNERINLNVTIGRKAFILIVFPTGKQCQVVIEGPGMPMPGTTWNNCNALQTRVVQELIMSGPYTITPRYSNTPCGLAPLGLTAPSGVLQNGDTEKVLYLEFGIPGSNSMAITVLIVDDNVGPQLMTNRGIAAMEIAAPTEGATSGLAMSNESTSISAALSKNGTKSNWAKSD